MEFNASRRAIVTLESGDFLDNQELKGAKKVLSAAAMTLAYLRARATDSFTAALSGTRSRYNI